MIDLPCILIRDESSIQILNLDTSISVNLFEKKYDAMPYISETKDLQIACAGFNQKFNDFI